ncbi:hypothetical protein TNCV_1572251 [Trichonephila clavipes]|uniref:Uncharacterized protein n=1 Tax=Trichonephila clavipes TaxID=2585209 RepID=A0A8X6VPA0_TRICX|nr:hypothetical protein TNCV_1572251 [Trichonephila clavipes]
MSFRIEGYDGKGVSQCYTCNIFHHSSENYHLTPRYLKCGEAHITRECPIKQRLEIVNCINCQVYGYKANWKGCPCFPKGTAKNNRNSCTNIYNSLIRPNISYAQAAVGTFNSNKQQMAPLKSGFSAQTEIRKTLPPKQEFSKF